MIRHSVTTSLVRLWASKDAEWGDPYDAILTLLWESHTVVQIVGFHGQPGHRLIWEFLDWAHLAGIKLIKADRHGAHRVPGAVLMPDGMYHTDVAALAARHHRTRSQA